MGLTASLTGAALFAIAPAVGWVFAGRALMGLGVGLAMGPASAAVIEFSAKGATKRAGAITTTATAVGLALAAHAGGLLIDFGPDPTLQQRWDEGQHSAKILHEELQTKGYLGHYERVKMAVAPPSLPTWVEPGILDDSLSRGRRRRSARSGQHQ
jgi:hypothetical protein